MVGYEHARPPRIEYAGAVYHVLNRGNYRQDFFVVTGSGESFEQTRFETCARFGWWRHAYVLLSNHYHLGAETTYGRLDQAARWCHEPLVQRDPAQGQPLRDPQGGCPRTQELSAGRTLEKTTQIPISKA